MRCSEFNVEGLEFIKPSQDTGTSDSSQDVGSCSLHQGHESFVLHDLHEAIHGSLVLDSTTGCHHHAPPDGVDGVDMSPAVTVTAHPRRKEIPTPASASQEERLGGCRRDQSTCHGR
eukprot:TRINITY_DN267_c0_g1_i7.p1 TRINITY_DN267_c0_g1~~TRINITY_DN267_c0_g1_i7.p1  ORF type:complete len:117 (+),score=14.56 TRINITY_DN267_c0_g1_i7:102-452(+)